MLPKEQERTCYPFHLSSSRIQTRKLGSGEWVKEENAVSLCFQEAKGVITGVWAGHLPALMECRVVEMIEGAGGKGSD
jgi:hypothetical protein